MGLARKSIFEKAKNVREPLYMETFFSVFVQQCGRQFLRMNFHRTKKVASRSCGTVMVKHWPRKLQSYSEEVHALH